MNRTPSPASRFDPYSPLSGVVQTVATGVFTLIDPAALKPCTRQVLRTSMAVATGAFTAAVLRYGMSRGFAEQPAEALDTSDAVSDSGAPAPAAAAEEPESARRASTTMAIGIGGGMAAVTYGWLVVGEKIDAGIHRALAGRGVERPRVVMALGAAGLTWVLFEIDRRTRDENGDVPAAGDETPS
ncbi:hypothetical protein [Zhihengliuella salsuginis]|uniref:DUF1206 domain-containing protein n=1 Tax=Zhihengliuella salsuginis TaxID=578222 RepID=A0ABQ3GCW0_9MICC|nr:hypothetical protein [Zhihengliuella salsuginis]GHC99988.1 hypothetical protein GCM10008096_02720 [Zhihengliuella salsuginis]